jgi:cytochrome c oxidase assembly protein subunit 15
VAASVGVLAAVAGAAARVRTDRMRLLAGGVGGLVIAQLVAGVLNVALLAPGWLQLVHLLLADVVWIGLTLVLFEVQAVGEPAGAEAPAVAGSVRAA